MYEFDTIARDHGHQVVRLPLPVKLSRSDRCTSKGLCGAGHITISDCVRHAEEYFSKQTVRDEY
jgi:hypothetical protein